MAYGQYKDLEKSSQLDKVLKDRAFVIAKNPKYDGYQRGLASMVHTFLARNQKELGLKMKLNKINN